MCWAEGCQTERCTAGLHLGIQRKNRWVNGLVYATAAQLAWWDRFPLQGLSGRLGRSRGEQISASRCSQGEAGRRLTALSLLFQANKVANSTLKSQTTIKAECGLARHAHEVANSDHAASRPEGRFGPTHCTAGMALDIAGDTGTGCRAGYNHALSSMQFC